MSIEHEVTRQRLIKRMRWLRAGAVFLAALSAFIFALNVITGSLLALLPATLFLANLALIVVQTRLIGTMRRRERELSRPRMTAGDYRRLRELEIGLGWEPSEVPAPEAEQTPPATVTGTLTASGGAFSVTAALSGTGSLSARCRVTSCDCGECYEAAREFDEQLREQVIASQGIPPARMATAAELHFAQLARVGRESCTGFCPICAQRSGS